MVLHREIYKLLLVTSHLLNVKLIFYQAVEYYAEWSLCPKNVVFLRVQTSVFDPLLIGDKAKWFAHQLQSVEFKVYDDNSSLGAAVASSRDLLSDDNPTGKMET